MPLKKSKFDPESLYFERWWGDRIPKFPEPEVWAAIQSAKRKCLKGYPVMIRRDYLEGKWEHAEVFVGDTKEPEQIFSP